MEGLSLQQRPPSAFSSNSTAAECTLPAGTLDETPTKLFCKRSHYPQQEVRGASNAAAFGLRVQIPLVTSSGELLYPFFEGKTQSELRLSLYSSGWSHWYEAEALLYTELVKAEDMLRLYSKCLTDHSMPKVEATAQPIHRFFHLRLAENARFVQFYGDSYPIGGKNLTLADFLRVSWKVNEVVYPPLNELFRVALDVLHPNSPQSMACPVIFGLGDAHGANVMVSNDVLSNNSRDVLYVDYEVAGFHPIMLDIAKALYTDVFFNTLYMDILPGTPETNTSW
ncbi:MAG: hypothetical protein Q9208_007654 [Pyrenodesmia sp. 3 TL-2023]